ncbi:MAG: sigma-70 family RNA polymerase sigma factor, partial [Lachnospiraceae bacterium]|nr:sigma-70 family RNA polymerase sigma factor [Lachnospiraceae bacterium]
LNMLDEKYRLVLMLYYVEGYKTSEISAILEVTESTVRTQLARGREKLAQAVTGKK